jgi:hypothetical protein
MEKINLEDVTFGCNSENSKCYKIHSSPHYNQKNKMKRLFLNFRLIKQMFVFCIFIFIQQNAYSQRLYERDLLQYYLNEKNLDYHCPKGWIETFVYDSKLVNGSSEYRIETPDHNVMILFVFPPFFTKEDSAKVSWIYKNSGHTRNDQYWEHAKANADTTDNKKIIYYSKKYTKKVFNADHAGVYFRKKSNLYTTPNRLDGCKVVFIFRKEVGLVELTYFYREDIDIDKYIKKTAGMIRFKKNK